MPNREAGRWDGTEGAGSAVVGRRKCSLVLYLRKNDGRVLEEAVLGRKGLAEAGEIVWKRCWTRDESSKRFSCRADPVEMVPAGDAGVDARVVSDEKKEAAW